MKKSDEQRLRERAINIRLNAYYKTGGVGVEMLEAERKANALEDQANALRENPSQDDTQ